MRLYLRCHNCNRKVYLTARAGTRNELAQNWGIWFQISCTYCKAKSKYHVNEVFAETDSNNTTPGAVIGGLIGLVGGPIGVISGATIGGALGHKSDEGEREKVEKFNNSFA